MVSWRKKFGAPTHPTLHFRGSNSGHYPKFSTFSSAKNFFGWWVENVFSRKDAYRVIWPGRKKLADGERTIWEFFFKWPPNGNIFASPATFFVLRTKMIFRCAINRWDLGALFDMRTILLWPQDGFLWRFKNTQRVVFGPILWPFGVEVRFHPERSQNET